MQSTTNNNTDKKNYVLSNRSDNLSTVGSNKSIYRSASKSASRSNNLSTPNQSRVISYDDDITSDYNTYTINDYIDDPTTDQNTVNNDEGNIYGGNFFDGFIPTSNLFADNYEIKKLDDVIARTNNIMYGGRVPEDQIISTESNNIFGIKDFRVTNTEDTNDDNSNSQSVNSRTDSDNLSARNTSISNSLLTSGRNSASVRNANPLLVRNATSLGNSERNSPDRPSTQGDSSIRGEADNFSGRNASVRNSASNKNSSSRNSTSRNYTSRNSVSNKNSVSINSASINSESNKNSASRNSASRNSASRNSASRNSASIKSNSGNSDSRNSQTNKSKNQRGGLSEIRGIPVTDKFIGQNEIPTSSLGTHQYEPNYSLTSPGSIISTSSKLNNEAIRGINNRPIAGKNQVYPDTITDTNDLSSFFANTESNTIDQFGGKTSDKNNSVKSNTKYDKSSSKFSGKMSETSYGTSKRSHNRSSNTSNLKSETDYDIFTANSEL
ncbi:putative cell-wall-anchored protein sasa (LPXTG motif) [Acanthamoeba polyphaga mimivirus]|uniref:Cell-wall-anchored protein sasa (LPXTG motif) n=1 Tax=Acanthamoeba polyphaga mimivirus Kroon TaxID=3069720 RepID=A0A0G2YAR5_9VIRU|nr:putative cell-wall-anchored protein sasa (LPXTG motif) [Acanthamoeba polyphaga mimivirus]AKI80186.1 putative cell-wall-anchored protein sasa (LPXTG motif) [Acanthamoeba polyphaga mimivirus Kroon]